MKKKNIPFILRVILQISGMLDQPLFCSLFDSQYLLIVEGKYCDKESLIIFLGMLLNVMNIDKGFVIYVLKIDKHDAFTYSNKYVRTLYFF